MRSRLVLFVAFLFALTGVWLVPGEAGRLAASSTRRPTNKPSQQSNPAPVFGVANDFAVSVPVRDLPAAGPVDPSRENEEGEVNEQNTRRTKPRIKGPSFDAAIHDPLKS